MLNTQPKTRYLVVDLEATCDSGRFENEIIEIGAVMWEVDKGVLEEFQTFVQPILNPKLTWFCKDLTSITQEDVDQAQTFPSALAGFMEWYKPFPPFTFLSWGVYDRKQIGKDCHLHKIKIPVELSYKNHLNLKNIFPKWFHGERCGVARALKRLGSDFSGTHHRGIDDARNITMILEKTIQTIKDFEGEEGQ